MRSPRSDGWLGASELGEFVYCARSWGLRAATEEAADPAAVALQVQGRRLGRDPSIRRAFAARRDHRESQRHGGVRAHRQHGRQARLGQLLAGAGLLLLLLALAAMLLR